MMMPAQFFFKSIFLLLKFKFKTGGKSEAFGPTASHFLRFMDLNEFLSDFYANPLLLLYFQKIINLKLSNFTKLL